MAIARKKKVDGPVPILSYASGSDLASRVRRLWVVLPFMLGWLAGSVLIGWVVCCQLGGIIVLIADSPGSPEAAFQMWLFVVVITAPALLLIALIELSIRVAVPDEVPERRPWWFAAIIGILCPCLPIALCLRAVSSTYIVWLHFEVRDGALALVLLISAAAPWLLLKRPRSPIP